MYNYLSLFGISTPKNALAQALARSVSEHWFFGVGFFFPGDLLEISVAIQPLKECAIVVCELRHCKGVLHGALPARPCEELSPGRKKKETTQSP